jgi:hypothetical protein
VLDYKPLKSLNKFPGINWSRPVDSERNLSNREKTADLCLSLGGPPENTEIRISFWYNGIWNEVKIYWHAVRKR